MTVLDGLTASIFLEFWEEAPNYFINSEQIEILPFLSFLFFFSSS
jgi:hypothetical protein